MKTEVGYRVRLLDRLAQALENKRYRQLVNGTGPHRRAINSPGYGRPAVKELLLNTILPNLVTRYSAPAHEPALSAPSDQPPHGLHQHQCFCCLGCWLPGSAPASENPAGGQWPHRA